MNPFQNFINSISGYMAEIPPWEEVKSALDLIRRENARQRIATSSPYSSMPLEQPMRTRYGVAMDQGSLDWMVSLARKEREEELIRQENERMLDENWEKQKWDFPYRGTAMGVGWGP